MPLARFSPPGGQVLPEEGGGAWMEILRALLGPDTATGGFSPGGAGLSSALGAIKGPSPAPIFEKGLSMLMRKNPTMEGIRSQIDRLLAMGRMTRGRGEDAYRLSQEALNQTYPMFEKGR